MLSFIIIIQQSGDFLCAWHDAEGAAFCCDEGGGGIGEGEHFSQFVFAVSFPPVVEDIVENSAEESIAGAGGFDGIFQNKGRNFHS